MEYIFKFTVSSIPYLCLLATILFIYLKYKKDIYYAIALGSLIWTGSIWLFTYILSYLNLVYPSYISYFWIAYAIYMLANCIRYSQRWKIIKLNIQYIPILIILSCTLLAGLLYPPNNYDVLTYHMPRVMHWLQNHSLAPYATTIDRQIGMAPLNAMIAMQSYCLMQSDLCVNMGQWLAFTGCILAAGKLTAILGGRKNAIYMAVIFAATVPAAIIQASNTDSCLLVSFFILFATIYFLKWIKSGYESFSNLIIFATCAGFAILSKGSAYPLLLPIVLYTAWKSITNYSQILWQGILAALIIIVINAPHLYYNHTATGNLVSSSEKNVNFNLAPNIIAGNIVYNFLINEPVLLSGDAHNLWRHLGMKLGLENNQHVLPWGGIDKIEPYFTPADGTCPNPLHTLFILLSLPFLIRKKLNFHYGTFLGCQFLAFCALLAWHPWMARIQITLFFLFSPLLGISLQKFKNIHIQIIATLLLLNSLWPLFLCVERPLLPPELTSLYRPGVHYFMNASREKLLFNNYPWLAEKYLSAAENVTRIKPGKLHLELGDNGMEYPVWVLLKHRLSTMPYISATPLPGQQNGLVWRSPRQGENRPQEIKILENSDKDAPF